MKANKVIAMSLIALAATGCHKKQTYDMNDFVSPNRVVEKKIRVPAVPYPKVKASFGIGNDPLVVAAYRKYTKTGKAPTIRTNGWTTYPYSANTKPLMKCQPAKLCIIQLEPAEMLNSIKMGDTANWEQSTFVTGRGPESTISITVKPRIMGVSTDLIVSTSKRTYQVGLVSSHGVEPSILRFYYPEETAIANVEKANEMQRRAMRSGINSTSVSSSTMMDVNRINFNYRLLGARVPWSPIRVFDDTNKTFIELADISTRFDLPILYLVKNNKMELVNYRYKAPYFIVDGLFERAWLISGKGKNKQRVEIVNRNLV